MNIADFARRGYITDSHVCDTVNIALALEKPLLVEGDAGVGKTELAKVLAAHFKLPLIRLQCYEGLDEAKALYEWDYQKQLLRIQANKIDAKNWEDIQENIFSDSFLLERPLLRSLKEKSVLLIDEIDKVDEEFEAFLLEILSDFQVSIPELGTIQAIETPIVVLTSNAYRELSDALKRRCIYLHIDYPTRKTESHILMKTIDDLDEKLAKQVAEAVSKIREQDIEKKPSISESIDWAKDLLVMGKDSLNKNTIKDTLNVILKTKRDMEHIQKNVDSIVPSTVPFSVEKSEKKGGEGKVKEPDEDFIKDFGGGF
ncbi:MoxR family ATPase [Candidatus Fermentibacteria bacterium]|nr:MAG: MoxR family ATPase [Candidatus Fermentibacteria bacterium]